MKMKTINRKNNNNYKKNKKYSNINNNKVLQKNSIIGKKKRKNTIINGGYVQPSNLNSLVSQSLNYPLLHPIYTAKLGFLIKELSTLDDDKSKIKLILNQKTEFLFFIIKPLIESIIRPIITEPQALKEVYDKLLKIMSEIHTFIKTIIKKLENTNI